MRAEVPHCLISSQQSQEMKNINIIHLHTVQYSAQMQIMMLMMMADASGEEYKLTYCLF